jgi:putative transposase
MARKKDKIPDIQSELIEQFIRESGGPQALFDKEGLLNQLKKRLIEKALVGELDEHIGYPKHTGTCLVYSNTRLWENTCRASTPFIRPAKVIYTE